MSIEAENLEIIRSAYRIWSESLGKNIDHWIGLMDEQVRFDSLGGGEPGLDFSRACKSKADVRRYFVELVRDWQMIHYTVEELVAQGERVVMLGRCEWKNRKTGKSVETPKADFIKLRNGRVVEFLEFFDTAKVLAATV